MTKFDWLMILGVLSLLAFFNFTVKVQSWQQLHHTRTDRWLLVLSGGPIIWIVAVWFWLLEKLNIE